MCATKYPQKKTKRNNSVTLTDVILKNSFVSFSLKENLPDGTVISETPVLTLLNDNKLPDIVKTAFSVGEVNSTVTIVALAKQVYTSNDYPKNVTPDTSII
ncbi:hypothetical protein BMK33_002279 [Shigella flexneri]|nr:hypothetical protein [Shigella flexneri]